MITKEEFSDITGNNLIPGFNIRFDWEFIVEFLENLGYDIIIHEGIAKIKEIISDCGGSVEYTGKEWDDKRKTIIAIKSFVNLPERLDSKQCKDLFVLNIFETEIKNLFLRLAFRERNTLS